MPKEPFDVVKWSFILVATVVLTQVILVAVALFFCLVQYGNAIVVQGKSCGEPGQLAEIMSAALAAALGFAGGRLSK
jgi:glycine betaine/choline ABC-type transport system substrate-binding protein